jgi:UDP-glucuronate 4-epimerase
VKILITGSAGFIGFNFSKFLLEKTNYTIIGIDNLNDYYSVKVKLKRLQLLKKYKKFSFIKTDIVNQKKINTIFKKKIDIVFHFAAQAGVRYSLENPRSYIENNILGFFNIIEASINNNVKKIFYASSSSVYGDSKKFPLKETDIINPKNIYGLTKKINEEISALLLANKKMSIIGFRFFTVFGEWGRPDMLIFKYLRSCFNKKEKFYLNNFGNHTRDFTYIKDVNKTLFNLLKIRQSSGHKVLNICSNKPVKITKIIEMIKKYVNTKSAKIVQRKFQLADVIKTHGNNSRVKKFSKNNKFTKLDDSIKNTVNWYNKNWKIYN